MERNLRTTTTEFMKSWDEHKIVPYISMQSFTWSIDIEGIIHVDTLAVKFNVEVLPENYNPLKTFLLIKAFWPVSFSWHKSQKGVLYIAIAFGHMRPYLIWKGPH